VIVREVLPGEGEAVGALRVEAYKSGDFLASGSGYADTLRVLGFDGHGTVFVAAEDGAGQDRAGQDRAGEGTAGGSQLGEARKLLGTVMLDPWHPGSEVSRSPDDIEVRAFAVAPWAQGRGVGRVLMRAVIDAAAASGARRLLLSTQPQMAAAQHLYRSLGFVRMPELDWAPVPEVTLLGFGLPLDGR
jgi:ribosomal protein S18 acetylase RimI-like enzyme